MTRGSTSPRPFRAGFVRGMLTLALAASALSAPPIARATAVCASDGHVGGDWAQMGGDLGHARNQTAEKAITRVTAATLKPYWTFSANSHALAGEQGNEITGYPIIANGCVYVGTARGFGLPGYVFAINADGGDLVWKRKMSFDGTFAGGIYSSIAAHGDLVYAYVSRVGAPFVVALNASTGAFVWKTTVDTQPGSDAVASPVVYDGMVWVGVSGTAAEGDESQRSDFRGKSVWLDALDGRILDSTPSIPDADWRNGRGDAGGAIWSTISIDPVTKFGYVGSGNPFSYENEHKYTNAVLKFNVDKTSPKFGDIAGSYKGDVEQYAPLADAAASCDDNESLGTFAAGFECGHLDLDFGAAPNLFTSPTGQRLVGAGQKSGVYHVFDAETMELVWKQIVGIPSLVGGIVGTPAFDGSTIYAPHTIGGYMVALDRRDGRHKWITPIADAVHWGSPVTAANGVLYTVDLKGFLDAYDAATGAPLLHRPMGLESDTGVDPTFSWAGVSVARNTVYATVGVGLTSLGPDFPSLPDGFVIAFRPRVIS